MNESPSDAWIGGDHLFSLLCYDYYFYLDDFSFLEIFHSLISGKRRIFHNTQKVYEHSKFLDSNDTNYFLSARLGKSGHRVGVHIKDDGKDWFYDVTVNDSSLWRARERALAQKFYRGD